MAAVGAVGALVMAPASAALADAAVEPTPDAEQPLAPEIVLPSAEQVDQVVEEVAEPKVVPEEVAPEVVAPEVVAEEIAPEVVPTDEVPPEAPDPADAGPAGTDPATSAPGAPTLAALPAAGGTSLVADGRLMAAPVLPEGYYGTRKIHPSVYPSAAETPEPDLTSTITATHDDGTNPPWTSDLVTSEDGSYAMPFGFLQAAGEQVTMTLTDAPEGFMLPADTTVFFDYCVVEIEGNTCASEYPAFEVTRDYRRVGVQLMSGSTAVAGATVELREPLPPGADPGDPHEGIAAGMTDASGVIVFPGPLPPAAGYQLVVTDVPDGMLLPDPVLVDLPAVDTVAEADLPVMVPIAVQAYGRREIFPQVTPMPAESPAPDLTATVRLTHDDGTGAPWDETLGIAADGALDGAGFYAQTTGETLTFTLLTAPDGFMLPADVSETVGPCIVDAIGTECRDLVLDFGVVRDYRRVGVHATQGATGVAGVTVQLYGPLPSGAPAGSPRTLLATGTTDVTGAVVFGVTVPPGTGYLLTTTAVPAGMALPASVALDLAAVDTVAQADVAVMVPLTIARAPATLPATGTESGSLALLAAGLVLAGAGALWAGRRISLRG